MKKQTIAYRLLFAILLLIPAMSFSQTQKVEQNMFKFGRLLRLVESSYVDTTNLDKLTESAIVGLLKQLDPHSVYIAKDEVEEMNEPLQGSFEGIGISFNIYNDTLMVVTTIPGGPSEKVGLRPGDRIIQIDEKMIAGISLKNTDVFKMLKGPKGTKVNLQIKRHGEKELLAFTIVRDKIPINSLDASYMLNNETGYIKLNRFAATTTDEFLTALRDLKKGGKCKNIVLDLRGNGGGFLNAAYELADNFLDASKMIVYTEGVNSPRKEYKSSMQGEFEEGKVVILIDEGSASASEILSGAIQDWDRGLLVGRRSFGKGLVQQQYYLTDGSMVRLTTAHYYTPSGRCIQRPYDDGVDEYRKDPLTRYESGELFSADSVKFDEKLIYHTMLNKRKVYGGGGIMPDIFVPMDTSKHYQYYNQLLRKNLVYDEVLNLMDTSRDKLKRKYADFDTYNAKFEVEDSLIDKIVARGEKEGVKKDDTSLEFVKPQMKQHIKALIARDLFSVTSYYQIMNSDDDEISKALEVLSDPARYNKLLKEGK